MGTLFVKRKEGIERYMTKDRHGKFFRRAYMLPSATALRRKRLRPSLDSEEDFCQMRRKPKALRLKKRVWRKGIQKSPKALWIESSDFRHTQYANSKMSLHFSVYLAF
jgi:hypothetical protein